MDVLTAFEGGCATLPDPELLDRATELGRVIFTQDRVFLNEATRRQREGIRFAGVIYGHQLQITIGQCVADLELIAKLNAPEEMAGQLVFLPL